jgi:hypothetical protein
LFFRFQKKEIEKLFAALSNLFYFFEKKEKKSTHKSKKNKKIIVDKFCFVFCNTLEEEK